MRLRYALPLLLLLAHPGISRAQDAPENLLPAGTQIYLRWDGIDAHRAAYARTSLGKMMQGDTGTFVTGTFEQIQEGIAALLTVEQLLGGVAPEKLKQMRADAAQTAKLLPLLGKSGFIFAAELKSVEPPQAQVTFVLPGAGPNSGPLFSSLRLGATLLKAEIKEAKIDGRAVTFVPSPAVNLVWWVEGKHAVVRAGVGTPEALVKAVTGKAGPRLSENPLYKRVSGFKGFTTSAHGFVDVPAFTKFARSRKEATQLLDDLGVDGIKGLVFYSGFEGVAERGLIELDVPGPRKGALALLKGKSFRLADVPPLPPDVVSWSMSNLDLGMVYDLGLKLTEDVVRLTAPDKAGEINDYSKKVNDVLGTDLRKDLLGSLDGRFATYNTPSEGPFTLGQTVLLKVKDEQKLEDSLEQAIRGLAKVGNADVRLKKRTYRGVVLREVIVREKGFFFRPTYAIHNGWLVLSFFPQPVQAYVSRAKGDLRSWKPSPQVKGLFEQLPKDAISLSYSDPRPTVKQVLSLAPLIAGAIDNLNPDFHFDVGSIPSAQEVTRHLFPNLAVTTDDGSTVRLESRSSLPLPFELSGIESYGILLISLGRVFGA